MELEKQCVGCASSFVVDTSTAYQSWGRKKYCEDCKKERRRKVNSRNCQNWRDKNRPSSEDQALIEICRRKKLRQATLRQIAAGRVDVTGLVLGASRTTEERSSCWTPEKRAAQATKTLSAYQEGRMQGYGRYRGKWAPYDGPQGQINMRSQSEVLFAQKLDQYSIKWQYEPRRFDLGWATYCPDFYLPTQNVWVEVKGWLTEHAAQKIAAFQAQGHQLIVTTYQEVRQNGLPAELSSNTLQST